LIPATDLQEWSFGQGRQGDHGRLMLTVLGGLAEFERELIRARTGEGRKRAMAKGVKFGRRPKLTPHQRKEVIARRDAGESETALARLFNVHQSTIHRTLCRDQCNPPG
jgi:DNA invertase Pin-like site-specific DNA recombinase